MNVFSTITGSLVDFFRGGTKEISIHQSMEGGKPQTSMSGFAPGLEINPANGENIVVTKIKGSNSFVVSIGGVNQNITPDTLRGERRIYSVSEDGTEIKAVAKFKNDGVLELNGATDSAVLFSELKTAYDQVVSDLNDLVTAYNAHIHNFVGVGPGNPGVTVVTTSTGTPSTGDISPAESLDVKLS